MRSQNQLLNFRTIFCEKVWEKFYSVKLLLTSGCKSFTGFVRKDLNFIVDRLTGWTEKQWNIFKKSCFPACVIKLIRTSSRQHKRAQILNAEIGKLNLLSKLQQSFINKFSQNCVLGVQWSFFRRKILGVFQDSQQNHSWWSFQTSYCTILNAHLRRSFFGKFFRSKSCDFKNETFGWCYQKWHQLHMSTDTSEKIGVQLSRNY